VSLGLACGTKWSGLWFVALFGLLSYFWDYSARRGAGLHVRPALTLALGAAALTVAAALAYARPGLVTVLALLVAGVAVGAAVFTRVPWRTYRFTLGHGLAAVGSLVLVPIGVYLATWTGWFLADPRRAYNRTSTAATVEPEGWTRLLPGALRALGDYHRQALDFHTGLTSPHDYASNPWGWAVLARPVNFFYEGPTRGKDGCAVDQCSKQVIALGTPALWWGGVLAVLVIAAYAVGRRDWRAVGILTGLAAGYLPWFAFQDRTIYSFYAVVMVPWVVLAVTMCLGLLIGPPDAGDTRRIWGTAAAGTYVCLVVLNFAFLYPILTAQVIPQSDWQVRMWLGSWI
jgi:hypothetical protein